MATTDTPVMQQYWAMVQQHPGFITMVRMGDFYEMFGDAALTAAEILQITLTKRHTGKADDAGVPMCGVPYHAAEGYIAKLLAAGQKVALAEQLESPEEAKKRGSNALVKRGVIRLYTPGTLTEDTMLETNRPSYLAALTGEAESGGGLMADRLWRGALAWLDLSTGEVGVRRVGGGTLASVLASLQPGEVVTPPWLEENLLKHLPRRQISTQEGLFAPATALATVKRAYNVQAVEGLGLTDPLMAQAVGAVLGYAELTQLGKLPTLRPPAVVHEKARLAMDPSTRRNLELTESLQGKRADSLLGIIDKTATGAGARLLARWVAEPLTDLPALVARQQALTTLTQSNQLPTLRNALKETGDIARSVSRLLLGRGGPRDLDTLRRTGQQLPMLATQLENMANPMLTTLAGQMRSLAPLTNLLHTALSDDPLPPLTRDGGFIRDGYDAELDGFRNLQNHGNDRLQELERTEQESTGISTLKLRYNKVWGYYFELSKNQASSLPTHFIHRQTTTQTQRFTTQNLLTLERELSSAGANTLRREAELFEDLIAHVRIHSLPLLDASEALATLDVLTNGAALLTRTGWVLPTLSDDERFDIHAGRHPVVGERVAEFVPNDCHLHQPSTGGQLWLVTGPNMAGKSTFLRQNALMVVLAQMGYPVPAAQAHIGLADAVFSRIGAADNLAAGQSTFMVEMVETAGILNRATRKSLVVLDEIGRGTATYDGLAIAWAVAENLSQTGCRTLFATHYHELTALSPQNGGTCPNVSLHQVTVKEWKGDIVFLHEVKPGAAAGSYGVQVAKLAGVPEKVLHRADTLLSGFLKSARGRGVARVDELSLFAAAPTTQQAESAAETRLKNIDIDNLSPREALEELYNLQSLVK